MATIASLTGKVNIEGAKQAGDDLKGMSGHLKDSAGGLKGLLGQGLAFAGAQVGISSVGDAFGFVKDQLGSMVSAGLEANRMDDILAQGLKSTHDASGMTTQSLDQLSTKIMGLSGIDDDSVKSAEQMLLTFTGIGKNAFPAATQAAADMATRMNGGAIPSAQQMQDAALQLGKALNDPATGMTALQRVGVTFTQQQKDQIKAMQASGDSAGAQAVILKELQKEFGGSAEAAGKANGGMAIMTASVNNAKQQIGQALAPAISDLTAKLAPLVVTVAQKLAPALTNLISFLSTHQQVLAAVGVVIGVVLVAAFTAWAISAASAAIATLAAAAPVLAIVAVIGLVVAVIVLAVTHWHQITDTIGHFKDMILSAPAPIKVLAAILLLPLAPIFLIIAAIVLLKTHWTQVMDFMGIALHAVVGIAQAIGGAIGGAIKGALNIVITDIDAFIGFLDSISIHIPAIGVGPVHTPSFDWNGLGIPKIPMLARGGDVSGLFYGAEAGMELLTTPGVYRAPAGSHVYNASDTAALLGSGGIPDGPLVIQIAGRTVAQLLWPDLIKEARRSGGLRF